MGQCCSSRQKEKVSFSSRRPRQNDGDILQGLVQELLTVQRGRSGELRGQDITSLMDGRDMQAFCRKATWALLKQPTVLDIESPVHIVGDIHGQFEDLLRIFDHLGLPPSTRYLFLGDYVDRGPKGLEVMVLLLALQMLYPTQVYLLRGNHECENISMMYGFFEECKQRYRPAVWKAFIPVFDAMPIACLVQPSPPPPHVSQRARNPMICVHAGLSRHLTNLQQLRDFPRPLKIHNEEIISDLVWSDPSATSKGWGFGERGVSCTYGMDVARAFLRHNNLSMIVRAHEMVDNGFLVLGGMDDVVATVFSAPGYAGVCDNDGATMEVTEHGQVIWHVMPFHEEPKSPGAYREGDTIVIHSSCEVGCLPTQSSPATDGEEPAAAKADQHPPTADTDGLQADDISVNVARGQVGEPAEEAAAEEPCTRI